MYRLKLFGGIVIEGPYGSVAGRAAQPRQLALLALLATSDPPIGRDKLTGRLWPEEEDRRARRRLSDTLYVLRQELGDEAVLAVGDALELNGTVVGSDLADYEAALESGDLEAAVSLYAGPFLDGFFYSGSGPFERWVDAQRKRLARTCGIALETLAASAEEKGDLQDAVGWWRRLVDLDPYSARAVRRLMEALVALGDRPAALRVARAHVQRARAELDAPPDRELVEFVARLRSSDALEASPGGRGVSGERPASAEGEAASGPRVPEKSARGSAPPDATVTEPEAGRAPPEAGRGGSEGPDRRAVAARAAVAVLLLLAAAASLAVLLPSGTGEASRRPGPGSGAYEWPADDLSLAVLPFENETANPQSDYFVRGMADELYMGLARIPNLEVASRASVARLTGDEEISEIARTLGVTHVVDGSVRRTGHRVRIAARLVDAGTGQPLWGATYDRELSPDAVLGVRAEIARHIATALRTRLARVERLRIARPPTGDLAAYDFYLKGREHLDRGDLQSAEALFRNALERDSQLAVARVYLARAYGRRGGSPEGAHRSADSVYTHVGRALALDSKLPDAWVEYSNYLGARGHVRARLEALERAVRLDPNHAGAVMRISAVHADRGRLDESVHWLRKTVALEPSEAPHYARMGVRYADLGDFQEAERWLARALELAPSSPWAHGGLAILHLLRGDLPLAASEVRTLSRLGPEPDHFWARFAGDAELRLGHYDRAAEHYQRILPPRAELRIEPRFARPPTAELGFILLRSGDTTRAEQLLGEAEEWAVRRVDSGGRTAEPFWTRVMVAAVRGETDAAIGHLERAVERGWDVSWRWYYDDAINPLFEGLAGLPRYERLLVELAARVDSQRQRLPDSPEPSNRLN